MEKETLSESNPQTQNARDMVAFNHWADEVDAGYTGNYLLGAQHGWRAALQWERQAVGAPSVGDGNENQAQAQVNQIPMSEATAINYADRIAMQINGNLLHEPFDGPTMLWIREVIAKWLLQIFIPVPVGELDTKRLEEETRAIAKLITHCPFCDLEHNPERSNCDAHNGVQCIRIRNKGPITREELSKLGLLEARRLAPGSVEKETE